MHGAAAHACLAGARESLIPHAPRHEQGNSTGPAKPKAAPKKADKAPKAVLQLQDGRFVDHRWENGRWTLSKFANPTTSQMDWPAWNSVRLLRERIASQHFAPQRAWMLQVYTPQLYAAASTLVQSQDHSIATSV